MPALWFKNSTYVCSLFCCVPLSPVCFKWLLEEFQHPSLTHHDCFSPPTLICRNPHAQSGGIRSVVGEALRRDEIGVVVALLKRSSEGWLTPFHEDRGRRYPLWIRKHSLIRHRVWDCLNSGFPSFQNCEKKKMLVALKPPTYGV